VAQTAPPPFSTPRGKYGRSQPSQPVATLDPEASSRRRDELLAELGPISSLEAAAEWAKRIIPIKNTLTADHARDIERALEPKLKQFGNGFDEAETRQHAQLETPHRSGEAPADEAFTPVPGQKTVLKFEEYPATPKTRRLRDKRHRQFVGSQACLICGGQPSDAHHLRFAQPRGLGLKVSDEFTVPLCRYHHRELHRTRNETQWWAQFGIQPMPVAYKLWTQSHPAPKTANTIGPALQDRAVTTPGQHDPIDPDKETIPI
jgi:hypothetical protein